MPEIDDRLRDPFQRKAGEVPPHGDVPRSLARRARRRAALTTMGIGLAVVILAAGTTFGLRALGRPGSNTPIAPSVSPTPRATSPSSSPTTPGVTACTSSQLRATGSMEGAMGSREGAATVTNDSDATCTLEGSPTIALLDQDGNPITVQFDSASPWWEANALPEPPGWPVVRLRNGDSAMVRIRWSNWCPQGAPAPIWQMAIPGGGAIEIGGFDALDPPPCNGPDRPSTVEVGPFEPPLPGDMESPG
jgi:hypothetical protein